MVARTAAIPLLHGGIEVTLQEILELAATDTAAALAAAIAAIHTFANTDLSGLPTSNPGGGKPWLNGGVLQVGA